MLAQGAFRPIRTGQAQEAKAVRSLAMAPKLFCCDPIPGTVGVRDATEAPYPPTEANADVVTGRPAAVAKSLPATTQR